MVTGNSMNGRLLPPAGRLVLFGGPGRQGLVVVARVAPDAQELLGQWARSGFGQVIGSADDETLWFLATNPKARVRDPVRWLIRAILALADLGAFGEARGVTANELLPRCRLPERSKPQPGLYSSTESLEAAWLRAMRDRGGRPSSGSRAPSRSPGTPSSSAPPANSFMSSTRRCPRRRSSAAGCGRSSSTSPPQRPRGQRMTTRQAMTRRTRMERQLATPLRQTVTAIRSGNAPDTSTRGKWRRWSLVLVVPTE